MPPGDPMPGSSLDAGASVPSGPKRRIPPDDESLIHSDDPSMSRFSSESFPSCFQVVTEAEPGHASCVMGFARAGDMARRTTRAASRRGRTLTGFAVGRASPCLLQVQPGAAVDAIARHRVDVALAEQHEVLAADLYLEPAIRQVEHVVARLDAANVRADGDDLRPDAAFHDACRRR